MTHDDVPDQQPDKPLTSVLELGEQELKVSPEQSRSETPLAQCKAAFRAELAELLEHHRGEWIAYADGKMVRFGASQAELYRHCLNDLGLPHDRFLVRHIIPESSPEIEVIPR